MWSSWSRVIALRGSSPACHVGTGAGPSTVEASVAHEQPDERLGDALRHRPRDERRVGAGLGTVPLDDHSTALHDDDCLGQPQLGRLGEGSIEDRVARRGHACDSANAFCAAKTWPR